MSHKAKAVLEDGEAFVIATLEFWNHLIGLYESQIENPQDDWAIAADFVRKQVKETLYYDADAVEDWD